MPIIQAFGSHHPSIAEDAFVAGNATIIGEVKIGAKSSIWFQAVLRGDVGAIQIGERTNIQDAAILHCTTGRTPTIVGNEVVVGHRAILHGCQIEDQVLIGMGAIVLDEVVVPSQTIIAAGALVPEGKHLKSGWLYAGVPAKPLKPLTDQQLQMIRLGAAGYVEKSRLYLEEGRS
ncbi:MAG: gamma carbonic anhydrase family protein [Bacteroidota bacterium]